MEKTRLMEPIEALSNAIDRGMLRGNDKRPGSIINSASPQEREALERLTSNSVLKLRPIGQ